MDNNVETMMAQVRLDKANAIADKTSLVLADALESVLESLAAVTAGSPWLEPFTCFFCGSHRPLHEDSCSYVRARCVLEEYAEVAS